MVLPIKESFNFQRTIRHTFTIQVAKDAKVFLVASGSRAERTRPAYDATQGAFYFGAPSGYIVLPLLLHTTAFMQVPKADTFA